MIVALYATPSLVAGYIAAVGEPGPLHDVAILGLPWLTVVLGAAVTMVVVGYHGQGRSISLGRATIEGLRWVPRYVWTNTHTTLVFWVPVGILVLLRDWTPALSLLWTALIAAVALYIHTRTLLAPFLAVHDDMPGSLAALEAWRLSGRSFPICFATFVAGTLPVAAPLLVAAGAIWLLAPAAAHPQLLLAAPNLVWAGIHAIRPVLVPALYCLHRDLWEDELRRRRLEGEPAEPWWLAPMRALTRPLPRFGRWMPA